MPRARIQTIATGGRPKQKSGLPAPVPGEPFSLLGTLRRCTRMLTIEDAAFLLNVDRRTAYRYYDAGILPPADLGLELKRIDPKAWADQIEHKNPHLRASARASKAA